MKYIFLKVKLKKILGIDIDKVEYSAGLRSILNYVLTVF